MTSSPHPKRALVTHGGAGVSSRDDLNPGQAAAYRDAMAGATEVGVVGVYKDDP